MSPRADSRRAAEIRVRYDYDVEAQKQLTAFATEFVVFYRDQFGTVHVTATPEDWWASWFKEHGYEWADFLAANGPISEEDADDDDDDEDP